MKFKPITKYCIVGIPLTIIGILSFMFTKFRFFSGSLIGAGVTIIILNLIGKLKK